MGTKFRGIHREPILRSGVRIEKGNSGHGNPQRADTQVKGIHRDTKPRSGDTVFRLGVPKEVRVP